MPCAFFSAILRSSWANRYGGMRSPRLLGLIQLLDEIVAERRGVHAPCPAGQRPVQGLPDPPPPVAAVEVHRNGTLPALEDESHGGARRAGAGRERLPHAALEYPRRDLVLRVAAPERDVGPVGEEFVRFDRRTDVAELERL